LIVRQVGRPRMESQGILVARAPVGAALFFLRPLRVLVAIGGESEQSSPYHLGFFACGERP